MIKIARTSPKPFQDIIPGALGIREHLRALLLSIDFISSYFQVRERGLLEANMTANALTTAHKVPVYGKSTPSGRMFPYLRCLESMLIHK